MEDSMTTTTTKPRIAEDAAPLMAPNVRVVKFSPARIRVFFNRLPFFTRTILLLNVVFAAASLIISWLPQSTALIPSEVGIWSAHRLNTYPFAHTGLIHCALSLLALIPLLDRFEGEHGTLVCFALFTGPFSTFPGITYIILEHIILRGNKAVQGAGVWIFLLLCCEAIKTYRANPNFKLGSYSIPTYLYPLPLLITSHFLLPTSLTTDSVILNLCSCSIGYGFELGYLKFLIPPEWALRFIESKLNLLGRLPHYVSVDQKTYGRYGVLPTTNSGTHLAVNGNAGVRGVSPARFVATGAGAGAGAGTGTGVK